MSKDHERLDKIFSEFKNSEHEDIENAPKLLIEFKEGIERHIRWEEEILFPLVESKLNEKDPAIIKELLVQHKRIKEDVDDLYAYVNGGKATNKVVENDLGQLLIYHDKMEEEGIYPWIDEFVDEKNRESALHKMML